VATASRFDHPALFYRDQRDYLSVTVPFIRDGLAVEEPVMVAVPPANLQLLREALGGDAAEIDLYDMSVAGRNPGRIIADVLLTFADKHAGQRVRIIGEPIWPGRTATEYPACVQHEALINTAFAAKNATILCPYQLRGLSQVVIDDAKRTHPTLWADDDRMSSGHYVSPFDVVESFNVVLPAPPAAAATMAVGGMNLAAVRAFAAVHGGAFGLGDHRLDDAVLVVNELATNTLSHTRGQGTLTAWAERDQVVFQIVDEGHIADPLAGRRLAPADQVGGRGLLLVHRLSDLVRIHTRPGQTTVRVYFNLAVQHR
jgi:anti-sigma regulatory factor (Ser/Thr protein kinase)